MTAAHFPAPAAAGSREQPASTRRRSISTFARWTLAAYVVLAPIISWLPSFGANPVRILGCAIAALGLAGLLLRPPGIRSNRLVLFGFAFLLLTAPLGLLANPTPAVLYEMFPAAVFLATALLLGTMPSLHAQRFWLYAIAISGGVCGLLAWGLWSGHLSVPSWKEDFAARFAYERTGWAVDSLSGVLGQFAVLVLLLQRRTPRRAFFLLMPLFLLNWTNILLAQFRAYVVLAMFLSLGLLARRLTQRQVRATLLIALVFVTTGAGLYFLDPGGAVGKVTERFLGATDHVGLTGTVLDNALTHRELERAAELDMLREKPLLGFGWGISGAFSVTVGGSEWPLYGHNLYTSHLARFGVLGASAVLAWWLVVLLRTWRRRRLAADGDNAVWAHAQWLLVLGLLAVGLVGDLTRMSLSFPCFAIFWSIPYGSGALTAVTRAARVRG